MSKSKKLITILAAIIVVIGLAVSSPFIVKTVKVNKIVSNMSIEDKITQMLMVDFRRWGQGPDAGKEYTTLEGNVKKIISDYHFGAVILFANNIKTTEDTFNLTKDLQNATISSGNIPMLIATDQEGGIVYRLGSGTALPGNMALAATGNPEYSYEAGKIIGSELSCLGINTTLAPVVDVNNNPNNPVIGLRSFSDDPAVVAEYAGKMIDGIGESNVIACLKHYPGHGDVATDSHYGLPIVDKSMDELMANELVPYQELANDNVDMIMTAHILYPQVEKDKIYSHKTKKKEALPATMSDDLVSKLLKDELGFKGVVCTDAMDMEGVSKFWNEDEAVINAINAGVDMICMPTTLRKYKDTVKLDSIINSVKKAVENGEVSEDRIDDACRRIISLKYKKGILDYNADDYSLEEAKSIVGSKEHRAMERDIAAAAVTVVKNDNSTLPIKVNKNSKVLVLVPYSNETAQYGLAWNRAREAGLIPKGAEITTVVWNDLYKADIEAYKNEIDEADTIIINSELSAYLVNNKSWEYTGVLDFVKYAEKKGKATVVVSVNQPYDVTLYKKADAVLAVYGCKGSSLDIDKVLKNGITDSELACGPNITAGMEVILGTYEASGKLPIKVEK